MLLGTGEWIAFYVVTSVIALCIVTLIALSIRHMIIRRRSYYYDIYLWPVIVSFASVVVGILAGLVLTTIVIFGVTSADIAHDLDTQGYQVVSVHQDSTGSYYRATVRLGDGSQQSVQTYRSDESGMWEASVSCAISPDGDVSTDHCVALPH